MPLKHALKSDALGGCLARLMDAPDLFLCHAFMGCSYVYLGVFLMKQGRSLVKQYGCIFTCINVRAVHLEVVHSLSTHGLICLCPSSLFNSSDGGVVRCPPREL